MLGQGRLRRWQLPLPRRPNDLRPRLRLPKRGLRTRKQRCRWLGSPDRCGRPAPPLVIPEFLAPILIAELSDPVADDDDPSFTADSTVVILNSNRAGGLGSADLWTSSRANPDQPWPEPTLDSGLSSDSNKTTVGLSPDGLTVVLGSNRPGGVGLTDVWPASRVDRASPWSTPINPAGLNSDVEDLAS